MKICIVANNPHVCHIPDEYDLYLHFNWANNFALTPVKKNILAMRVNDVTQKMRTFRWHHYGNYAKQVIAIGQRGIVRAIDKNIEMIDTDLTPGPPDKDNNPTSGFAGIHYYLKKGYDVTICGFDIDKAIYRRKSRHHLDWEKQQIAEMVSKGIIKSI